MSGEYPAEAEYRCFHISQQGISHKKAEKEKQDSALSASLPHIPLALATVSDGHGGDRYFRSELGSQFAVDAATECSENFCSCVNSEKNPEMLEWMESPSQRDVYFQKLAMAIVSRWYERVHADWENDPFRDEELKGLPEKTVLQYRSEERIERAYGATLAIAAITPKYWFVLQLGDGSCVAVFEDGHVEFPTADDVFVTREGTATSSLCDVDAHLHFRYFFSKGPFPVGLFVATDGVENCFPLSSMNEWLTRIFRAVTKEFLQSDFEEAKADLSNYMEKELSKSGDDISIAGMVNVHGKLEAEVHESESKLEPTSEPKSEATLAPHTMEFGNGVATE